MEWENPFAPWEPDITSSLPSSQLARYCITYVGPPERLMASSVQC